MTGELKTYAGWLREGRAVQKGERANFYALSPDKDESRALFAYDQTAEPVDDAADWFDVVPAEARPDKPTSKKTDPRPKVILDYRTTSGEVTVWVGPNTKAIKQLRDNNFAYNPRSHRWVARRDSIDKTFVGLVKNNFRVEATIDGAPYDGPAA